MEQTEQAPVPKINVTYCRQIEDISDIKPMRTDIIPDLSHKVKNWYYLYQLLTIPSCHTLSSFRPTGTACKPVFTIFNILISPETRLILPSVVFLHDPKNSVIKLGFFRHWGYCLPRCPQSTPLVVCLTHSIKRSSASCCQVGAVLLLEQTCRTEE